MMMIDDSAMHLTEDELHDVADGRQPPEQAGRIERHLALCARCRADIDRIRELLSLAAALPRSIEPATDLWPEIGTRMRADRALPAHVVMAPHPRWDLVIHDWRWLAAAAVLLILASSALTRLFLSPRAMEGAGARDSTVPAVVGGSVAASRTVSDDYDRMDRDILALLERERRNMHPETVAKVERNLAIIDGAIAEIRQALAEDPGNEALLLMLKASYGQKSALVRQVSSS